MSPHTPRPPHARLDVLLAARVWRTRERTDSPVAATCRNIGSRGCRFCVEDARLAPGFDVNSHVQFSLQLEPQAEISGGGQVAWVKKEHGDEGKVRLVFGVEFTSVSFSDQERIKAFIQRRLPAGQPPPSPL